MFRLNFTVKYIFWTKNAGKLENQRFPLKSNMFTKFFILQKNSCCPFSMSFCRKVTFDTAFESSWSIFYEKLIFTMRMITRPHFQLILYTIEDDMRCKMKEKLSVKMSFTRILRNRDFEDDKMLW